MTLHQKGHHTDAVKAGEEGSPHAETQEDPLYVLVPQKEIPIDQIHPFLCILSGGSP